MGRHKKTNKLKDVLNANPKDLIVNSDSNKNIEEIKPNLSLLSEDEILKNYNKARISLEQVLDSGLDLIEKARETILSAPAETKMIEATAKLINSVNETASILASIHKEVDMMPGLKSLNLDNSKKEYNLDNSAITEMLNEFKSDIKPTIEVEDIDES